MSLHATARSSRVARLWMGALAALVSGAAMFGARIVLDARTPVDMIFDLTGHVLGVPSVFNVIHSLPWGLDHYAKYGLFAGMAVLYLAAWALLALPLGRAAWPVRVIVPALATPLLVGLVLLPLEGLGLFGVSSTNYFYPPLSTHLWAAAFGLLYGVVLLLLPGRRASAAPAADGSDATPRRARGEHDARRREFLGNGGRTILLLAVGAAVGRAVLGAIARAAAVPLGMIKGLSAPVTPTADHYVVSKNFLNPSVDAGRWKLKIGGMVEHPLELSLDDLKAMPSTERTSTLMCISNEVGGDLIGNSLWTGVPLADLLDMAGVHSGATEIILRAADNYSDSFPVDLGRRDGTMVAYLQNGEPLTRDHGFPARVLLPGIYGMKNVKWVVELELTDKDYQGYWQQRGWSDEAVIQTMSRIDTARATKLADGTVAIGGIAFAGVRGIQKVEVSVDGGSSWQEATLDSARNEYSWNLWGFAWDAQPGTYDVLVRATDGTGATQTSDRARPLPDGATGWDETKVQVS